MPTLLVMRGAVVDQRVPLPGAGGRLILGRHRSSDVVLEDPGGLVSRRHAEIHAGDGGYTVTDLDSGNGIWRDGRRLSHAALDPLHPIIVGPYRLLLAAVDIDPLSTTAPTATAHDARLPAQPWPGSRAAVLLGIGLVIGILIGGLLVWVLVSAGSPT